VTRFKELRRIENALKHRDERELRWALSYCKMRLSIGVRKDHTKVWEVRRRQIEAALGL